MTELRKVLITDEDGDLANVGVNGGLDVNLQDQTTQPLDFYFSIPDLPNFTTLTNTQSIGDTTVTLDSVTGFTDGTYVGIFCPSADRFYFGTQLGAPAGNVITLDSPLDFAFIAGDNVAPLNRELNVDGSTTTVIASVQGGGPTSTISVDITRLILHVTDATAMDDSKFGGITGGITNGILLRRNNGVVNNIWNLKTNGEMGQIAFDKAYDDRAPSGFFGIRMRYTLAGQDKHGVAIRLEPGETLELLIQDDLTPLVSFRLVAEGHVVEEN